MESESNGHGPVLHANPNTARSFAGPGFSSPRELRRSSDGTNFPSSITMAAQSNETPSSNKDFNTNSWEKSEKKFTK